MITKINWDLNTRIIELDKNTMLHILSIDQQMPIHSFYHERTRLFTDLDIMNCKDEKDFLKFADKAFKLLQKIKNITQIECDINIYPAYEDLFGNVVTYSYSCKFSFDMK